MKTHTSHMKRYTKQRKQGINTTYKKNTHVNNVKKAHKAWGRYTQAMSIDEMHTIHVRRVCSTHHVEKVPTSVTQVQRGTGSGERGWERPTQSGQSRRC